MGKNSDIYVLRGWRCGTKIVCGINEGAEVVYRNYLIDLQIGIK